jgi:ABC-type glycerol-3-phosphate transport system permease component
VSRLGYGRKKIYWRRPHYIIYHSLVWVYVLAALLPFAQMIWTAQKPRERVDDSYYYLSIRMPEHEVAKKIEIDPRPLRIAAINSTIVSSACAVLGVVFCSMAGYAFAKKRFRGRTVLFDLVLAWMALPTAILMMPLFRLTVGLGIYDTLLALILPFCVTGFGIFYMRYAITSVPDSLIDSARVDGLSEFGALFRVVLPSIWRSVLILGVIQFITSWNLFVLPHAVVASHENYTVSILLGRIMSDFQGLMWSDIMKVVIAALVPIGLIYVVLSRWVIRGYTSVGDERD